MATTTQTDVEKKPGRTDPVSAPLAETEEILKAEPEVLDYSGAREKSNPREIKLVRKLDLWIMPMLWLMYWLNYLVRRDIMLRNPMSATFGF